MLLADEGGSEELPTRDALRSPGCTSIPTAGVFHLQNPIWLLTLAAGNQYFGYEPPSAAGMPMVPSWYPAGAEGTPLPSASPRPPPSTKTPLDTTSCTPAPDGALPCSGEGWVLPWCHRWVPDEVAGHQQAPAVAVRAPEPPAHDAQRCAAGSFPCPPLCQGALPGVPRDELERLPPASRNRLRCLSCRAKGCLVWRRVIRGRRARGRPRAERLSWHSEC